MTPAGRRQAWAAGAVVAASALIAASRLSRLELVPDEAYYWDWSRHLAAGYYDQGPFIAWLIRGTTAVFGSTEFGVRIGATLCVTGAIACAAVLACRLASPRAALFAALLLAATPFAAVGSVTATYDAPLVLFWALTALLIDVALASDGPAAAAAWIGAGAAAGLGLLSKHTMALAAPAVLAGAACTPAVRARLRAPWPWIALLLPVAMYAGVLRWNAQHHWWTFRHLLLLTHKADHTPLARIGEFAGSQLALLGPIAFALFIAGVVAGLRAPADGAGSQRRMAAAFAGVPLVFFCLTALRTTVQANWAPYAWLTAASLAGAWVDGALTGRAFRVRAAWAAAAAATGLALTAVAVSPRLRVSLGWGVEARRDPLATAMGWRETARVVDAARRRYARPGTPLFLACNDYEYCAELAFYLPDHPDVDELFLHNRLSAYAVRVDRLRGRLGQDALWVNDTRTEDADLRALFGSVQWLDPAPIRAPAFYAQPVRTLQLAVCRDYRRYVGLAWARGG